MQRKLIAILRGIEPQDASQIARIILGGGIDWLEVTTNSPDYLSSLKKIKETAKEFPHAKIGVGTVLTVEQVVEVQKLGADFIVSPNTDPQVIRKTKELGLLSVPGFLTPSEAFTALREGADILKFFPTQWIGKDAIKDLRAVLPSQTQVYAVGGVTESDYLDIFKAGFDGVGIGSGLYKAGRSLSAIEERVKQIVKHYDEVIQMLNTSSNK